MLGAKPDGSGDTPTTISGGGEDTGASGSPSSSSDPVTTSDDEEPLDEGGIPPWMYILGLAVVMGLITIFLKNRNSDEEDDE